MDVYESASQTLKQFSDQLQKVLEETHEKFPLFCETSISKDEDGMNVNIVWKSWQGEFCFEADHHHPMLIRQTFFVLPLLESSLVFLEGVLEKEEIYTEKLVQLL